MYIQDHVLFYAVPVMQLLGLICSQNTLKTSLTWAVGTLTLSYGYWAEASLCHITTQVVLQTRSLYMTDLIWCCRNPLSPSVNSRCEFIIIVIV